MRVDHGEVERRQRHVGVGDGDEHGAVDDLLAVLVHGGVGLVSVTSVRAGHRQRRVGKVELGGPSNEGRLASDVGDRGDVAVVGADRLAWGVPFQQDLLAREGQRLRSVPRDGGTAAVASLVQVDAAVILLRNGGWAGSSVVDALPDGSVVGRDTVDVGPMGKNVSECLDVNLSQLITHWLATCKAGKFCHARRVWFSGQLLI